LDEAPVVRRFPMIAGIDFAGTARANSYRATLQMPQGLAAPHSGELFPVNESRRIKVWMRCAPRRKFS
jgi:hypothetical protein